MPGMGCQNAVCLMVYTDNFRRFNYDARKIACYYGIAPFGRASGSSINTDPHVHYMGNRQIKAMLAQAALAAIRYNKTISKYYSGLVERVEEKAGRTEQYQEKTNPYCYCHGQKSPTLQS